jgi:hypothetical protein
VKILAYRPTLAHLLTVARLASLTLIPAGHTFAQSPYFPNTQAVTYNPYGNGPYGSAYGNNIPGWGSGAGLRLGPLPAAYSQSLPSPNFGYRTYNNVRTFGSGPYTPSYGGYSPYGYGRY